MELISWVLSRILFKNYYISLFFDVFKFVYLKRGFFDLIFEIGCYEIGIRRFYLRKVIVVV